MSSRVINSQQSLKSAIDDLSTLFERHKYLKVSIRTGKDRSLSQNAIAHAWYQQVANELKEDDALDVKCYCKLHHGVPILRAEDAEFREMYDSTIKGMHYEQKLKVMKYLPVTSLMTVTQLSKYLEQVQEDFLRQGVKLEFPEGN